jgi:hypothetical protein
MQVCSEIVEEQEVRARSLAHSTLGVKGVLELWDGTKKNDKKLITHTNLYKLNNKLVSA